MVTASRNFICVRPQTYESAAEAEVLLGLYPRRMQALRNTVFALLAPDGETRLARTGRSPSQVWSNPAAFASALNEFAVEYIPRDAERTPSLPLLRDLPIALNVAACDSMPLVVLRAQEDDERSALAAELAAIAWSPQQVGRWHYVVVAADAELGQLEGLEADFEGVALIAPDSYARSGEVLAQLGLDATPEELALSLAETLAAYEPPTKRSRQHVSTGKREGISWESELPVSDPQARDD